MKGPTDNRPTRRSFLGLAAAGAAGSTLAPLATAAAAPRNGSRSHYQLFQPGRIGPMTLKNRFVRAAAFTNTGSYDPKTEGESTDDTANMLRAWSEGGVSMVMTGYMAVMHYGKKMRHLCAFDDKFIPGLARVAEAVHGVHKDPRERCRLVAEIGHDGTSVERQDGEHAPTLSPTGIDWGGRIGPSGINWRGEKEGHILTEAEIDRFTTDMARAAKRLKDAGWDGINIHGAHHYLISTFLSPFTNRRTDRYGGSMEKRVEIVRESVQKMRDLVGWDFAILIKLNCDDGPSDDGTPEEINIDTFPRLAGLIEAVGVDAIDISGANPIRAGINDPEEQSYFKEYAARTHNLTVPVILSGGNRNIDLLEDIYNEQQGKIDFFAFARPLIRQPYLIQQWLDGGDPASECINVNLCFRALYDRPPRPAHCVVLERQREAAKKASLEAVDVEAGSLFGV